MNSLEKLCDDWDKKLKEQFDAINKRIAEVKNDLERTVNEQAIAIRELERRQYERISFI